MLLRRSPEQMRPQLGFLDDEGARSELLYDTLHKPGKIDRQEEDSGLRHHSPRHGLASRRKGRQDDTERWELLVEGGQNGWTPCTSPTEAAWNHRLTYPMGHLCGLSLPC